MSSRLVGIVPMRILFWGSLDYFESKGFNPITAAIATSMIQTSIDYPIEQIKIQKMVNNKNIISSFKNIKFTPSITFHLCRNIGFAVFVNILIKKNKDSIYLGAIGGVLGSIISHPFDSLKTWYQSGNKNFPKHWKLKNYMQGWQYRCTISLLSMNIGWIVYYRLKKLLEK